MIKLLENSELYQLTYIVDTRTWRIDRFNKRINHNLGKKEGPIVFTTVVEQGAPNSIYANCVSRYDEETLVVANNFFDKSRKNILSGSKGLLLFIIKGCRSYQIKGEVEYHTEGEIFDDMKRWNPPHRPGHGAAAIKVKAVFSGSKQLV